MFKIYDGRDSFWQWDTGQKLIVEDDDICCEVHFSNGEDSSIPKEVYKLDGVRVVDVPDILLQSSGIIAAYAYAEDPVTGAHTERAELFFVVEKPKPEGYIYSQTETLKYQDLLKLIGDLKELDTVDKSDLVSAINEVLSSIEGIDPEEIRRAVEDYLIANPPGLPGVSEEDDGKVMAVVGGKWVAKELLTYQGSTEITPSLQAQTLDTSNRLMQGDIIVNPIPYNEVGNTSNGTTITIG